MHLTICWQSIRQAECFLLPERVRFSPFDLLGGGFVLRLGRAREQNIPRKFFGTGVCSVLVPAPLNGQGGLCETPLPRPAPELVWPLLALGWRSKAPQREHKGTIDHNSSPVESSQYYLSSFSVPAWNLKSAMAA